MDFTGGKPLLTSGLFESLTAQIDILVDRANTNMLQKMCLTASALATIGWAHCAEAAPVLWSMAPSGTGNSPNNSAQALDELTAPLSSDEMGLSNSVEFNTIFDNDLDELRKKRAAEQAEREREERADDSLIPADPLDMPAPSAFGSYCTTLRGCIPLN